LFLSTSRFECSSEKFLCCVFWAAAEKSLIVLKRSNDGASRRCDWLVAVSEWVRVLLASKHFNKLSVHDQQSTWRNRLARSKASTHSLFRFYTHFLGRNSRRQLLVSTGFRSLSWFPPVESDFDQLKIFFSWCVECSKRVRGCFCGCFVRLERNSSPPDERETSGI